MDESFDIFRVVKLKTWGIVGGADAHNARTRPCTHADPARTALNRVLIGDSGSTLVDVVREKIGTQKIRSNAVLAVELIVSASAHYFRPESVEKAGAFDQTKLDAWASAKVAWLKMKYGSNLVRVDLHLDEATPHLHAVLVPLDDRGRLNCRSLFGGTRLTLSRLQDESATAVSHLGILRGIRASKACHSSVRDFYQCVNSPFEPLPEVVTQEPAIVEKPGLFSSKAEKQAWEDNQRRTQQFRDEVSKRATVAPKVAEKNQAKAAEAELLKKQVRARKQENSALSAQISNVRTEANRLRGLPLTDVLERMYGAQENENCKPASASRKFEIADSNISIDGDKWIDTFTGKSGKGAINLVMHIENLPDSPDNFRKSVALLADAFGDGAATEAARHAAEQATEVFVAVKNEAPPLPLSDPNSWQRVREYLVNLRRLPEKLIEFLHERGKVFADSRGNAVFVRDGGGAFVQATVKKGKRKAFQRTLGSWKQGCGAFIVSGNEQRCYVCESPVDALSLKSMHPEATVIAHGCNAPLSGLRRHLDKAREIFLAHRTDKSGNEQADKIHQVYTQCQISRRCKPRSAN